MSAERQPIEVSNKIRSGISSKQDNLLAELLAHTERRRIVATFSGSFGFRAKFTRNCSPENPELLAGSVISSRAAAFGGT
jgi:hypothetical protein